MKYTDGKETSGFDQCFLTLITMTVETCLAIWYGEIYFSKITRQFSLQLCTNVYEPYTYNFTYKLDLFLIYFKIFLL